MGNDVEEGEISDTASVEEISKEDFNIKQEEVVKVVKETKAIKVVGGEGAGARVWTMRDLYNKYPTICRGYGPGLHNLAWAQAVQNKPLNDIFVMEVEQDDASKRSSPASSVASVNSSALAGKDDKKEVEKVVIDDSGDEMEKEEGELEEGEIEMDLEPESSEKVSEQVKEKEVKLINVDSIREALVSVVHVADSDELFQGGCSKLENTLESLWEVVNENNVPKKDDLIQLAFSAVQSVHSVFCFMNDVRKKQNKEFLSRLLALIKRHDPPLFSSDQMEEMEVMISSLDARASEKEKDIPAIIGVNGKDYNALIENVANDLNSKNNVPLPVDSLLQNKPLELPKLGLSAYKSRGVLLPLLDPHKVHDVDSLPSPTRETTPCIPAQRALVVGDGIVKLGSPAVEVAHDTEVHKIPRYETEALRAVSSYQQKFGRNSFFINNELPSPTPSEDSSEGGRDTGGEISSAPTVDKPKPASPSTLGQQAVSSQPMDILTTANNHVALSSGSNPVVKPNPAVKASVKNRDPRLRFANSNALDLNHQTAPLMCDALKVEPVGRGMSSRKQKTVEETDLDGPAQKRQRNGLENLAVVRGEKNISGSGGGLEDTDMAEPQILNRMHSVESAESNPRKLDNGATYPISTSGTPNVVVCGNEPVPVTIPCSTASLPALLKDIAVNPTVLLNILKMGQQQKLAAEAPQNSNNALMNTTQPQSLSSIPLVNVTSSTPSGTGMILPKPMGALQVPSQAATMDEMGKVRMKPRDPRRVLHGNALQRSGILGPELKTDGPSTPSTQGSKENLNFQMQQGPAEAKPVLSQSSLEPHFTRQFTKNLEDIADLMSVSQPVTSGPMVSQNIPIQPGQVKLGVDLKAVILNREDKQAGTGPVPEVGMVGAHPQNTWGDVEHLFEGYDDHQKAAIQRERARRMEEQKKMFSARKLCLVLDLDHTLLNSAKFHEVDPVHDEMLRKKEEQDREKTQRHLFRFPHMGMWTKLRPGIWTFLERASKLFELHLYTMGNKLYATEMAKVLDPKGVLFAGRVISRGDDGDPFDSDERAPKSKDLEGVLGMESAVVIIDDSVRVWPHNKLNLIVVERYTYFPCSRRQFGLQGPSLLEIDHDERPEEGTLASCLGVIERMHEIFFSHQSLDDADVRNILAVEQRKILAGCRIVFSRVFPVGEANPHLHPLWQTAEQFGAVCSKQIDDQVTHVVANSLGTDKVNWALSTGRFVVHPGWVEASALLYRRANEKDFAIKP